MKKIITLLALIIAICISLAIPPVSAQMPIPIGPGDGDGNTTPIGGLAVLAALGGGYAVKKLRGKSREY